MKRISEPIREAIKSLAKVNPNLNYRQLGDHFGVSATFVYNLLKANDES